MNAERKYLVLLAPIISEKSTMVQQQSNQFVFKVARDSTKLEIKSAVEKLFAVQVLSVQTCNYLGRKNAWAVMSAIALLGRKPMYGWPRAAA